MPLSTAVDLYCERTGPGLWGEPLNVTSNVAFLIAAWAVWRLGRHLSAPPSLVRFFTVLLTAIGIGSTVFHVFATTWARVFDEGPILLFQMAFLWCYGRRVMRFATGAVLTGIAGLAAAILATRFSTAAVNNSLPYVPALMLTVGLGVDHARAHRRGRWLLLSGAILFAIAVFVRSIDNDACASFPPGTHVFWHVLAATVLYLFARGLLTNAPRDASM